MDRIVKFLEKHVLPFSVKLGRQKHLNAIKNGFIKILPLSLVGAMFVLVNNVFLNFGEGSFFYQLGVRAPEDLINILDKAKYIGSVGFNGTLGIMSLMAPFAIGSAMAVERKTDGFNAGLISVAAFISLTPFTSSIDYSSVGELSNNILETLPQVTSGISPQWFGGANVISGIIIGLCVGELYSLIVNKNLVIKLPDCVPPSVAKSFSAVIPGIIILIITGTIGLILSENNTNFHQVIMDVVAGPLKQNGNIVGWLYVFFSAFLWFFGIHGALALGAIDSGIMQPFALENMALFEKYGSVSAAVNAGETFNMWAKPMIDAYIFIGGTGATLGLIIAIFVASKRSDYRSVAKLGLPSGIFQINEPILFGLPIIMNPLFFIPYIIVQPVLAIITTIAYNLHIIPPITNLAPWTMPVGLGAFFSTNGSVAAMLVAFFNLFVATMIYLPFVITANKQAEIEQQIDEASDEDLAEALSF